MLTHRLDGFFGIVLQHIRAAVIIALRLHGAAKTNGIVANLTSVSTALASSSQRTLPGTLRRTCIHNLNDSGSSLSILLKFANTGLERSPGRPCARLRETGGRVRNKLHESAGLCLTRG